MLAALAVSAIASAATATLLLVAALLAPAVLMVVGIAVLLVLPRGSLRRCAEITVGRGGWTGSSDGCGVVLWGHVRRRCAGWSGGLTGVGREPESSGGEFHTVGIRHVTVWIWLAGLVRLTAKGARPTAATMGTSTFVHATESVGCGLARTAPKHVRDCRSERGSVTRDVQRGATRAVYFGMYLRRSRPLQGTSIAVSAAFRKVVHTLVAIG